MSRALIVCLLFFVAACGTPPTCPPDAVTVDLSWDNDSDLDLEVWQNGALVARADDSVAGTEKFCLTESGSYRIAISYFAAGPSGDTDVAASVTVRRGEKIIHQSAASLDDDRKDFWIPFEIDLPAGAIRSVEEFQFRGF